MEGVLSSIVIVMSLVSGIRAAGIAFELPKPGANMELVCDELQGQGPISWMKNNNSLAPTENGTFVIQKLNEEKRAQVGIYTCSNSDSSSTVTLFAAPSAKRIGDKSASVIQGETIQVKCTAWGFPLPTIKWKKIRRSGDDDLQFMNSNRTRVLSEDKNGELREGSLIIEDAEIDDYGMYVCIAENGLVFPGDVNNTIGSASVLVRVKDKYTPLWPLIGIIVEIIVLFIIIVVYEKRKSMQADSDDVKEPAAVPNSNDHDEAARLRK